MTPVRRATGPGRVNLIGDHTDYNQGLALPMAIGLGVSVAFTRSSLPHLLVSSTAFEPRVEIALDTPPLEANAATRMPAWARLIAAMVALGSPPSGGALHIEATLPIGSGLSSSAALCVALAEVFDVTGSAQDIALLCQQAEHLTGVPVGIMDPLVCADGRRGHALLIDFSALATEQVRMPPGIEVVVVDSGQHRMLRTSGYATRVAECEAATAVVGPLGSADHADLAEVRDPLLRRRARHVVSECRRVRQCAEALRGGDLVAAGSLMTESHRSLARDFEVSTAALDELVAALVSRRGVLGARMTGGGFGGCVVALTRPGAIDPDSLPTPAWRVEASDGTLASRGSGPEDGRVACP